jgi:hypothetical protein
MERRKWLLTLATVALLVGLIPATGGVSHADDSRYFTETGHAVKGLFLAYWNAHGGLAQQGYPISDEMQEQSDTDGRTYTMQYFERAVFEAHPENPAPNNVLLSLLGVFYYNDKYGGNAPNQHTSTTSPRYFPETKKTIGGAFRRYWETHGGLAQQGYPISDEFSEVSQTDGKTYTVQYFQRAVFEYHPEFAGTPNEVLLSLLGVFYYNKKHGGTTTQPTTQPTAPAQPTVTAPQPTATSSATPTQTPTPGPSGYVGSICAYTSAGNSSVCEIRIVDQSGRIFLKSSSSFAKKWTHVVSFDSGLLFYNSADGGGYVMMVDPFGTIGTSKVTSHSAGWDQIASPSSSILAFFNSTSKKLITEAIKADGSPLDLKTTTLTASWTKMVGMGNGTLFFYREEAGVMYGLTARVDAQGNFAPVKFLQSVIPPGWTHITRIDDTHLFFYNSASGQYLIGTLAPDGSLGGSTLRTLGAGWTSITVPFSTVFMAYRSDTGDATIKSFDSSYNLTDLKSYSGENALPKGWNSLTAIR